MGYSGQLAEIIKTLSEIKNGLARNWFNLFYPIAATGSLIAALASSWAASSAYRAMRNVQELARLGLVRNLGQVAYDVISEVEQVKSLVVEVTVQIQDLAQFKGMPLERITSRTAKEAQANYERLVPLQQEAQMLIDEHPSLESSSEKELSRQSSKLDGYLSTVRRVKYSLEKEAESYAAQNRMHQANVIAKKA